MCAYQNTNRRAIVALWPRMDDSKKSCPKPTVLTESIAGREEVFGRGGCAAEVPHQQSTSEQNLGSDRPLPTFLPPRNLKMA